MKSLITRTNAKLTFGLVVLLTIPTIYLTLQTELDHDFERFFSSSDPELVRYEQYRDYFGNDNDFLFICAENQPSVFDLDFLLRVDSFATALASAQHIRNVISPTRISEPRATPLGLFQVPWLRLDDDSTLTLDSARIWKDPRLVGNLFANTGQALMIVVETDENLSKEESDEALLDIMALQSAHGFDDARLAGRIHGQYYYIQKMTSEILLFFSLSVILLVIFLSLAFRSSWGVIVPVLVVLLAILWQVAIMTILGKPLTIMTMLLPTILFIVGMSDAVHIIERYVESLRNGHSKVDALYITYKEVGAATFLTSLTTAIGFLTLTTSTIMPIREFGIFTAIGVGIAFLLAFAMLPAVLMLVRTPVLVEANKNDQFWNRFLNGVFLWVIRNQRTIVAAFAALTILSVYAASQIKVDNTLLEDLANDDPRKQDFFFFEEHFGGVRPFEMLVHAKGENGSIWDLENLEQIAAVEEHLAGSYGISNILSPVTLVRSANKSLNGGSMSYYRLPESQEDLDRIAKRLDKLSSLSGVRGVVTPDGKYARISGRMKDEGGFIHTGKNASLDAFVESNTDDKLIQFNQTGMAYLIDRNNANLSKQLVTGLTIAFLLVSLIMAISFKRWKMVLVALIPNVIPLLFLAAIMYLLQIDLKVSTSIVFTIAFGIAVDDSIHILGKLRLELLKGKSLPLAMRRSFRSAGKAVIITSLMLVSGFISLVFSDFGSIHYMGLLVSMTLLLAIIADLLLLPVLVLWLLPKRKQ